MAREPMRSGGNFIFFENLNSGQQRAVVAATDANLSVLGGFGTGKSLVLLWRAHYLRRRFEAPFARTCIFARSQAEKTALQSKAKRFGLPAELVYTFAEWHLALQEALREAPLPAGKDSFDPPLAHRPHIFEEELRHQPERFKLLDFAFLDDADYCDPPIFRILCRVSRHVSASFPMVPRLRMPGEAPAILPPLAFTRQLRQIVLLEEFSPSPRHLQIIAEVFDPSLATDGEPEPPGAGRSRENPLLYYAPTLEAEADLLAEILQDRLLRNERVGILVPEEPQMTRYVEALQDRGFLVQTRNSATAYAAAEKGARAIQVFSFGAPQSHAFDTLIVTRMRQGCFGSKDAFWIGRYLARLVSCARTWCALGLDAKTPLRAAEGALRPLVEERKMAQLKLTP